MAFRFRRRAEFIWLWPQSLASFPELCRHPHFPKFPEFHLPMVFRSQRADLFGESVRIPRLGPARTQDV